MDVDRKQSPDSDVEIEALTELGALLIRSILEGQPAKNIRALIDSGAPLWYQDEEEVGISCLHAAAFVQNAKMMKMLIDEGAVWNAVDNLKNTAGDIALSYNNEACYNIVRDAGIRSELLMNLLNSRGSSGPSSSFVFKTDDATGAGSTDAFLSSRLRFTVDAHGQDICLLKTGDEEVGVMMGWERGIMQDTVTKLCSGHPKLSEGLRILNVGFGLGIIDSCFQSLATCSSTHIIIEPHPDVLQHMKDHGWGRKQGVKIFEGTWQDIIETKEFRAVGGFDVIYTDTFSEDYTALHAFFEHLPDLFAGPDSRFSFFNGLGATNALFYDVYTRLSELHLADIGLDVDWTDIEVTSGVEDRWGTTREYFGMPIYRLPVGKMKAV